MVGKRSEISRMYAIESGSSAIERGMSPLRYIADRPVQEDEFLFSGFVVTTLGAKVAVIRAGAAAVTV